MKTICRIATVLTFFIFAVGCTKDDASHKQIIQTTKDGSVLFEEAAVNHYLGLEYIYNSLVSSQLDSSLVLDTNSYNNLLNFVKIKTHSFLLGLGNTFIQNNESLVLDWTDYSFTWIVKQQNDHLLYDSIVADSLTNKQKELLRELSLAVYDVNIGYDSTLSVFEHIRERSYQTCNDEELIAMLAAVEIGEASLTYWYSNYDKWNNIFPSRLKSWFNWKELLGRDIEGAVTGAVTGFVTSGISGAGAGALAGGLGASAGSAALQLYHHWID